MRPIHTTESIVPRNASLNRVNKNANADAVMIESLINLSSLWTKAKTRTGQTLDMFNKCKIFTLILLNFVQWHRTHKRDAKRTQLVVHV